jgi:hypothetical protein
MQDSRPTQPPSPPPPETIEPSIALEENHAECAAVHAEANDIASPKPLTDQNQEQSMIEVHAPHESVRSWKDAFIHIAIIVVGLLIAVGLEQTVEHLHHIYQVKLARQALHQELEYNTRLFAHNTVETRWETAQYKNNLLVFEYLQKHPGTPQEKLPGVMSWANGDDRFSYGAWETVQQSGLTALMPQDEVARYAKMYHDIHHAEEMAELANTAAHQAEAYRYQDYNPSHLTPAQVNDEIALSRTLLMQHYRYVLALVILHSTNPEFAPAPTSADMRQLENFPDQQTREQLASAAGLTIKRMEAAGDVFSESTIKQWQPKAPTTVPASK